MTYNTNIDLYMNSNILYGYHREKIIHVPIFKITENGTDFLVYPYLDVTSEYPFGFYNGGPFSKLSSISLTLYHRITNKDCFYNTKPEDIVEVFSDMHPDFYKYFSNVISINLKTKEIDHNGPTISFTKLNKLTYDNIISYAIFEKKRYWEPDHDIITNDLNDNQLNSIITYNSIDKPFMKMVVQKNKQINKIISKLSYNYQTKRYKIIKNHAHSIGTINPTEFMLNVPLYGHSILNLKSSSDILIPSKADISYFQLEEKKVNLLSLDITEVDKDTPISHYKISPHGECKDSIGNELINGDPIIFSMTNKAQYGIITNIDKHTITIQPKIATKEIKRYTGEVVKCTGNINVLFIDRK